MKKLFFLLITGLTVSISNSQEISDAMRYAQGNITGTARFRALGGAFGALGGDFSALSVNPAGSAIFLNNQIGVTFSNQNIKNNSDYFGTSTSDKENSFILNQAGAVFVFNNSNPNNNWKKITIGTTYENTGNFNNNIFSAGINRFNSVDAYFLDFANGVSLETLKNIPYENMLYKEQQAHFGYEGYVINPVNPLDDSNTQYETNIPAGGNYEQTNEIYTSGYNSKLGFNIATSYKDRIYFGANLNVHITDYRRSSSFFEKNSNDLEATPTISDVRFNNNIYTYGNGFSFQLGAIAKITDALRLGVAYESNTWYHLYEEISQSLYSTRQAANQPEITESINPGIINVYEPYDLQTPGKFTFSGAYIFGKTGLISIDYSIKDYGNTKFKPINDPGFRQLNSNMNDELTTNSELRVGAEFKIKRLSLRGGYRFEGSPYKDGKTIGNLNSYSTGLGYNFGSTKFDLAYSYTERDSNQRFFEAGTFTGAPNLTSKLNNVTFTLLFEL